MSDSHLPTVSGPAPAEPSRRGPGVPAGRLAGLVVVLSAGILGVLGLAALAGEAVRNAVLVEVDRSLAGSEVAYSDAPAEAAAFFDARDTVVVRISRDMTVGEFLALYHLETNASARAALRDQLGAAAEDDLLREGDRVRLNLTLTRPEL